MLGLAVWGGLAFWTANLAVSRTSFAAEYRSALSIAYAPMLLEAMLGGLIVGLVVSYVLLRFHDVLPGRSSVGQSVVLSLVTLLIATGLVELVGQSAASTDDPPRYFLIGLGLNVVRFLALGLVIGYLRKRNDSRARR